MRGRRHYWIVSVVGMALVAVTAHGVYAKNSVVSAADPVAEIEAALHGQASWYSRQSPGIRKHTANMEIFDDTAFTCAMWDVPFNQRLRVTNMKTGRSIVVRVNDRGPHKRLVFRGRIIDLSKAAFDEIADLRDGLIDVKIEFL